jgi:hypothetical protein
LGDDKITAFAQLEPRNFNQAMDAVAIFGGCYIGVELPKFAGDVYRATQAELCAIDEALEEIDHGKVASEKEVAALFARFCAA